MNWPTISTIQHRVRIPDGFTLGQLSREQVPVVTQLIKKWYPTITVGMESVHLDENFFLQQTYLAGEEHRDTFPFTFIQGDELVGLVTLTLVPESKVLTGRLGVFSPDVRGHGLGNSVASLADAIAELMALEAMYFFATLQHPVTQKVFEHAGMQIVGIVPGYDLDRLSDGSIKRVPEALYAKVLIPKEKLYRPHPKGMTEKTKRLWDFLRTEGMEFGFWGPN